VPEIESVLDAALPAEHISGGTIETVGVTAPYLAHRHARRPRAHRRAPRRDAGRRHAQRRRRLVARWLAGAGWQVDEIRGTPDPEFGGGAPSRSCRTCNRWPQACSPGATTWASPTTATRTAWAPLTSAGSSSARR
jgi:hypothetical protein